MSYFGMLAVARASAWFVGFPRARSHRVLLLTARLVGVLLLQQTAERGARPVYEHGVGVIAPPGVALTPSSVPPCRQEKGS